MSNPEKDDAIKEIEDPYREDWQPEDEYNKDKRVADRDYYPEPGFDPEDFCDHDFVWTPTGVPIGDDEAPGQEYEGKCRLCGYTTKELLWIEWGETVTMQRRDGTPVEVRTVKRRADLAQCCRCGKILYLPVILFGPQDKDTGIITYQIDLCRECALG